jgi:hypothetical protein
VLAVAGLLFYLEQSGGSENGDEDDEEPVEVIVD